MGEKPQETKILEYSQSMKFNSSFSISTFSINDHHIKIEIINGMEPHQCFSSISISLDQIPLGDSCKVFNLIPTLYAKNGGKIKITFRRNEENLIKQKSTKKKSISSTELSPLQREVEQENPLFSSQSAVNDKEKSSFDELLHIFFFMILLYLYFYICFHQKIFQFSDYLIGFSFFNQFLDPYDPNTLIVSAYFPFAKSKYSQNEYNNWIRLFLQIINCKTLIYTSPDFYENYYKREIKNIPINRFFLFNFNLTFNNIYEVPCVKNLTHVFEKMHEIDREKGIHNPDLYAVWNSKIYFTREATFIYPNCQFYFWVDSGVVRDSIYGRLYDKNGSICDQSESNLNKSKCFHIGFPSPNFSNMILSHYSNPPLELCLLFVSYYVFQKHSQTKITNDVSQGIFFGSKSGIHKFYNAFWEVNDIFIKNNIFCGKEQDTFNFIFANYFDKINIYVFPAYSSYDYSRLTKIGRLKFRWFVFLSAFSRENPYDVKNNLLPSSHFLKS